MIWSEIVAKKTSLKILAKEKHSSLFVRSVIDNAKKFFKGWLPDEFTHVHA